MKILAVNSLLVTLLLALQLHAAPVTDTSMADDLQRVIRLCAAQPESAACGEAWTEFVRQHYAPGVDLERIIDDVVASAGARRASRHASTGQLSWTAETRKRLRTQMRIAAVKVLRDPN